ncbi:MAG: EF-hand domain-containing protein [Labilibaculum antarcticum]
MKVNFLKLGALALGLVVFSQVNAQEQKPKKVTVFAKMDANSDGFLDKAEYVAGMKGKKNKKGEELDAAKLEKMFARKDVNSDKKIDLAEFKAKKKKK